MADPVYSSHQAYVAANPTKPLAAGSYGADLNTAYTDPTTGAQVSGSGQVPLSNGSLASIGSLIVGARQPKNLSKIRSALISNGLISKNTKSLATIQSTWQTVVIGASSAQMDPFAYMSQLKTGGFGQDTTTPNQPQRQIYDYKEADRQKMIDDVSQKLRGQGITTEDKQSQWYIDLKKSIDNMITAGALTTSKDVYNPKTKKTESVSTTVPGFSQEQAAATAEKAIRKATPQDVARQDRVGFTNWMFGALGAKNG